MEAILSSRFLFEQSLTFRDDSKAKRLKPKSQPFVNRRECALSSIALLL